MYISAHHSTPKYGLSVTKQAKRGCGDSQKSPTAQIARQLIIWEGSQQNPEDFRFQKHQKPQISSIPGISPKKRNRYRVVLKGQILGERLSLDEALALAKRGRA